MNSLACKSWSFVHSVSKILYPTPLTVIFFFYTKLVIFNKPDLTTFHVNLVFPGHVVIFGTDTGIHKAGDVIYKIWCNLEYFILIFWVPMIAYNFAQWSCYVGCVGCDLGHKICCTIFTIQNNFMSNTECHNIKKNL